jgi:hypothetical protein
MSGMSRDKIATFKRAKVTRVEVTDDTAKAYVTGKKEPFELEESFGDWEITTGLDDPMTTMLGDLYPT